MKRTIIQKITLNKQHIILTQEKEVCTPPAACSQKIILFKINNQDKKKK